MILIKDIEMVMVQQNPTYVETFNNATLTDQELVRGREYLHPDGHTMVIGMTKTVQDKLGMPFDAMDGIALQSEQHRRHALYLGRHVDEQRNYIRSLESKASGLIASLHEAQDEIDSYKNMGFLKRLKFLFTGK